MLVDVEYIMIMGLIKILGLFICFVLAYPGQGIDPGIH
jgi:hypothetical protein